MTTDITTESATWSDHVIHWLLREEEISPACRAALAAELGRREAEARQPPLVLTKDALHALGAINARQLRMLGMSWPPKSGWLKRLVGTEISPTLYTELLAAKKAQPASPGQGRPCQAGRAGLVYVRP